jgi:hypothetical protein
MPADDDQMLVAPLAEEALKLLSEVLSNDAIEQAVVGPLPFDKLEFGSLRVQAGDGAPFARRCGGS